MRDISIQASRYTTNTSHTRISRGHLLSAKSPRLQIPILCLLKQIRIKFNNVQFMLAMRRPQFTSECKRFLMRCVHFLAQQSIIAALIRDDSGIYER